MLLKKSYCRIIYHLSSTSNCLSKEVIHLRALQTHHPAGWLRWGKIGTVLYAGFMLLLYISYIALDHYRLSRAPLWLSQEYLSAEDHQSIQQVGSLMTILESLFIVLSAIALFITIYWLRKDRMSFGLFAAWNAGLLLGIGSLGYIISQFSILPAGNAIQPIIIPLFLLMLALIYLVLRRALHFEKRL